MSERIQGIISKEKKKVIKKKNKNINEREKEQNNGGIKGEFFLMRDQQKIYIKKEGHRENK